MFDQDFLADLPAPRDDEPPQLRSDIADELADHLHCAYRREVLKDGDDESARHRVLERFGDPKKLARRLWWQAMWSRIMGQRLLAGLQWMVSLAAVTLAGAVFWQQMTMLQEMRIARQEDAAQRQALTNTLNQLRAQAANSSPVVSLLPDRDVQLPGNSLTPATPSFQSDRDDPAGSRVVPATPSDPEADSPVSLTVRLVSESETGAPVTDASVTVTNHQQTTVPLNYGRYAPKSDEADHPDDVAPETRSPGKDLAGTYTVRGLLPDRYELKIELPDGQSCTRSLVLRDDKPLELTIVCPRARKRVPLPITIRPLPPALWAANFRIECEMLIGPLDLNGVKWRTAATSPPQVTFDPRTGQPTRLDTGSQVIEFNKEADPSPDDRSVFLPIGEVEYRLNAVLETGAGYSAVYVWPKVSAGHLNMASHTVRADDDRWTIDLPDEFLAELTQVAQSEGKLIPPADRTPGPAPSAKTRDADPTPEVTPTLTLKFVEETADGPPARIRSVQITDPSGGGELAEADGPPYDGRFYFKSLPPDRYELMVIKADGQKFTQSVLIRDDKPQEVTILCPAPRKKAPVLVTLPPLPDDLIKARLVVKCRMWVGTLVLDGRRWQPGVFTVQELTFDPRTGQTTQILNCLNSQVFDLKDTPAEDRTVFLQTGPVLYRFEVVRVDDKPAVEPASWHWPKGGDDYLTGTITSADVQWKLDLPKEFVALLRQEVGSKATDDVVRQPPVPGPEIVPDAEAAASRPLGDHCRLILKFTSETKDGETPEGVIVQLLDDQGQRVGSAAPRRGDLPRAAAASADVTLVPPIKTGLCVFEDIEPGRYQLKVTFKDGRYLKEQLPLLRPGQERTEHVICPPPLKKATIAIQFQPPEDFRRAPITVSHSLRSVPFQLEGRTWEYAPTYVNSLEFDSASGLLSKVGSISVSQDRPEDRIIIVPSGPYRLVTQIYLGKQLLEFGDALNRGWPPDTSGERGKSTHTAEAGDNKWDIKVPDEFWSKARKKLAELEAAKKF